MNPDIHIRPGQLSDTNVIAVLATQVWLHTYATTGITPDIAEYVIAELTPRKYEEILNDTASHLFVAENGNNLIGIAVVKSGCPCPCTCGAESAVELQMLYVQAHFLCGGIGKSLLNAAEIWAREHSDAALWLSVNAQMSVINQFEGSIATFDEGRFSKRPMRNSVGIATDAVSY